MRTFTDLEVTSTERLTPAMIRVRFAGDLSAFAESHFTDRYVKLRFGTEDEPVLRTYTVAELDVAAGTLAIDFVSHGDAGLAGPWAASARPGDRLAVRSPGGAYAPDPTADWHLFAGDSAGLPAIRAALAALPADAVGECIVQVAGPEHEQPLAHPDGVRVTWLHDVPDALDAAVRAITWRPGRVHAFVHGEAEVVMHGIRPYLFTERGVPRADVSISGYWRRGRTEEGFRQWKADLRNREAANGV